ncbi:unnamed protein product [Caenorhabditis nigoni]
MSYGSGYNNRGNGGGFRQNNYNNGGGYSNGSNNYSNQYGNSNSYHNMPRVNEIDVPQSKHTIFIRGLHGDVTTEEIQEYIGQKVGKISFDFVKQAQDKSKLFVAVRFEKRDEAKIFMETYSDREFLGCRCELTWFRDIRRYCAYQRAKQLRGSGKRRRQRSDSDESSSKRSTSPPVQRRRSRSRSPRRSESRSQSRSVSRSPSRSPSRSKSPEEKKTRKSRSKTSRVSRSRSRSESSRSSASEKSSGESSGEDDVFSSRNTSRNSSRAAMEKKEEDKKRRRESIASERSEKAEKSEKSKKKVIPQIPLPPKTPTTPEKTPEPKKEAFIAPPTLDMQVESPPTNPYEDQQKVAYSVPLEVEEPPKIIVREPVTPAKQESSTPPPAPPAAQVVAPPQVIASPAPAVVVTPATPSQPAFVPRQVGKIEIVMPASLAVPVEQETPPAVSNASPAVKQPTMTEFPTTNKMFGHLKAFQSALLSTVRYEPPVKKEDSGDDFSTLRLSSMAPDEDGSDELKAREREEKLARLNEDQMMRFHIQKKKFETAFRNDCETYAVVTRALLAKDESLQFGLKTSLLENMEDLYKKMLQRVDDHLDALLMT